MSPEVAAILDARKALEVAQGSLKVAEQQLAVVTERWLEKRPDLITSYVEGYRTRRDVCAGLSRALKRAERVALAAGVLCDECDGLDHHHDTDCARVAPARAA